MSGPGVAKARRAPCGCVGSEILGYGACACFTCSECALESLTPIETLDIKDGEYGPLPYRPCAVCVAAGRPEIAA